MLLGSSSIHVLLECGEGVGGGHRRRQQLLKGSLTRRGVAVEITEYRGVPDLMAIAAVGARRPALVILDGVNSLSRLILHFQSSSIPVCAFDWFGRPVADLSVVVYPHEDVRANRAILCGLDSLILDPALEDISQLPQSSQNQVVVCLGSADVRSRRTEVSNRLRRVGIETLSIAGPYSSEVDTPDSGDLIKAPSPRETLSLLCQSRGAVVNGGTCMFETLVLRRPVLVDPQTSQETSVAKWMGVALVDELLDSELRNVEGWSPTTCSELDTLGSERVADFILNHL